MPAGADLKPYCEASERNRLPILTELTRLFGEPGSVLEIGSGTGQHAVYFAAALPHLSWLCSDLADKHAGINAWLSEAALPNVKPPIELDVCADQWPAGPFSYAFSANTAHIMSWDSVGCMFDGVASVLAPAGKFALYGPFNINGEYTSEGNRHFDAELRAGDRLKGIRDREEVATRARQSGMQLSEDCPMPANNRLLVFVKS